MCIDVHEHEDYTHSAHMAVGVIKYLIRLKIARKSLTNTPIHSLYYFYETNLIN